MAALVPAPGDFGGGCLIGECSFDAELVHPSTSLLGLEKVGSHFYGTWRDEAGNMLRAVGPSGQPHSGSTRGVAVPA
jgi:hypothetical protein